MNGDFKGDFSRDSYGMLHDFAAVRDLTYSLLQDTSKNKDLSTLRDLSLLGHFSRLLWQQGRVILDADLNEQIDILLYSLRSLARDLIGPQGGPIDNTGFALYTAQGKLYIRRGHYYVDGTLVSNEGISVKNEWQDVAYADQPYLPSIKDADLPKGSRHGYLAYLDVWERQITALENALISEFALGESSPDTATRAQLVWQVKVLDLDTYSELAKPIPGILKQKEGVDRYHAVNDFKRWLEDVLQSPARGQLAAKAKEPEDEDQNNACIIPPAASYRGQENRLYRVEIHTGGSADEATFVVSRENGSVLFPILSGKAGDNNAVTVTLDDLGRDDSRFALSVNDWVELVDEDNILMGLPGLLYQVSAPPDAIEMTVTLTPSSVAKSAGQADFSGKLLRLWNYRGSTAQNTRAGEAKLADDGALKVKEGSWFELEEGIQIQFQPSKQSLKQGAVPYRTGDYWLIPARTITGNVIWPQMPTPKSSSSQSQTNANPAFLLPHGVEHHYAPLAYINSDGAVPENASLQYQFKSLVELTLPAK